MKKTTLILALLIGSVISCSDNTPKDDQEKAPDRETMYKKIKEMEKSLFNEKLQVEEDKAMEMIALYNDYAALFPEDTNSAKFLYLAADVAGSIDKPKIKVQNYTTILEKYPDFKGTDHVMYLLAFTYDYDMDKRDQAKKYYQEVVNKASDTNFVRDSKIRLNTIDRMSYQQYLDSIFNSIEPAVQ